MAAGAKENQTMMELAERNTMVYACEFLIYRWNEGIICRVKDFLIINEYLDNDLMVKCYKLKYIPYLTTR